MQGHGNAPTSADTHSSGIAWNRYGNAMTGSGNEVPIKATQGQGVALWSVAGKCAGAAGKCAGMAWQSDGGANRNHAADEQRMAAAGRINALTCSGMAVRSNAKAWLSIA